MPQRSNDFQWLIHCIERQLAPHGAKVTESAMVKDLETGRETEVDVLIEASIGGHHVAIALECRKHGRPCDKNWINELIGKYKTLPVKNVVAVSSSGFTRGAKERAVFHDIKTYTFKEVPDADWRGLLAAPAIKIISFLHPILKRVLVTCADSAPPPDELSSAVLIDLHGVPHDLDGYCRSFFEQHAVLEKLRKHPELCRALELGGPREEWVIDAEVAQAQGVKLRTARGEVYIPHTIVMRAAFTREETTVPFQKGEYREISVAYAKATSMGAQLMITARQREDGVGELQLGVKQTAQPITRANRKRPSS